MMMRVSVMIFSLCDTVGDSTVRLTEGDVAEVEGSVTDATVATVGVLATVTVAVALVVGAVHKKKKTSM